MASKTVRRLISGLVFGVGNSCTLWAFHIPWNSDTFIVLCVCLFWSMVSDAIWDG